MDMFWLQEREKNNQTPENQTNNKKRYFFLGGRGFNKNFGVITSSLFFSFRYLVTQILYENSLNLFAPQIFCITQQLKVLTKHSLCT